MKQRQLTEEEKGLVNLVKQLENCMDQGRMTFTIEIDEPHVVQLMELEEIGALKALAIQEIEPTKQGARMFRVYFKVDEFNRYLHLALYLSGMKLLVDGSIVFADGFVYEAS